MERGYFGGSGLGVRHSLSRMSDPVRGGEG